MTGHHDHSPGLEADYKTGMRAARLNVSVSLVLLTIKFYAFAVTQSQSIFSDAMESIVNVIAGSIALILFGVAAKPADHDHPYGHGKAEYFSSSFEGGMIAIAAIWIIIQSVEALIAGVSPRRLDFGLILVVFAGLVNLGVGWYLIRTGKRTKSPTLVASGHHLISDFYTSAAIMVGLGLVLLTGITWLDPAVAIAVALHLGWIGFKIVKGSTAALMDAEDRELLETIRATFSKYMAPGIIRIHYTRVIRSGRHHHIDAHVVVPEFWSIDRAHEETNYFEHQVMNDYPFEGEIHFHLDPCRRAYCAVCSLPGCQVRQEPFKAEIPHSLEELTSPTEPRGFKLEV